ncbi:MAG TPA: hypothetical protein VFG83_13675 [Kofleriaceae bacterium]|nr:hypothetical protein [Kofleriaceae bacterium]
MSSSRENPGAPPEPPGSTPPPYEAPAIVWEEPYEPIGFGISCARQQGNPGCFPGPTFQ